MKYLLLVLLLTGCVSMKKGEYRDIECRVLGLDASIPIPMASGANIFNIQIGWVETRYLHGHNVKYQSEADHSINYLGTVHRKKTIGE